MLPSGTGLSSDRADEHVTTSRVTLLVRNLALVDGNQLQ